MSDEDKGNPIVANAWIVCPCGRKHKLIPAIGTPVYWCRGELLTLKEGDAVEIEETVH